MRRMSSRPQGERGTTLAELLVSMTIFSVIMAAVLAIAIGYHRVSAQNIARQDQLDVARVASERLAKVVRTAVKPSQLMSCGNSTCDAIDSFITADATSMKFYANLENGGNLVGPSQVTYQVVSTAAGVGNLVERVQRPDSPTATVNGYVYCDASAVGASPACKARLTTRTLATGVRVDGESPLFAYYGDVGGELDTDRSGLTASEIEHVLSIEVTLQVQSDSPTKPGPTTYIQRILMPNSQAVLRPGEDS